eukprot:scaffold153258_cov25-Tisochrysis_lutea.AAC.2
MAYNTVHKKAQQKAQQSTWHHYGSVDACKQQCSRSHCQPSFLLSKTSEAKEWTVLWNPELTTV